MEDLHRVRLGVDRGGRGGHSFGACHQLSSVSEVAHLLGVHGAGERARDGRYKTPLGKFNLPLLDLLLKHLGFLCIMDLLFVADLQLDHCLMRRQSLAFVKVGLAQGLTLRSLLPCLL